MNSRRVSLPCTLRSPILIHKGADGGLSPLGLSPRENHLSPSSPTFRRSLPSTPGRSLPSTPRTPSPRVTDSPRCRFDEEDRIPEDMEKFPDFPKIPNIRQISSEKPMRSFDLTSRGYVDRVVCHSNDRRRATCPDIYLYAPDGRPAPRKVVLRVYGSSQSGKRTIAQQIYMSAAHSSCQQGNLTDDCGGESRKISFILNGEEIQMEILIESAMEAEMLSQTIYVLAYRVDSRDSLSSALRIMGRLPRSGPSGTVPAILVANKCDLQRTRVVNEIEGRTLSKIYKVPFVEISALMAVNTRGLWEAVLRQLTPSSAPRSIFGKVVASCEQLMRSALSMSPSPSQDSTKSGESSSTEQPQQPPPEETRRKTSARYARRESLSPRRAAQSRLLGY